MELTFSPVLRSQVKREGHVPGEKGQKKALEVRSSNLVVDVNDLLGDFT